MKYKWIDIDNERVAVRKSLGEWRVVYPIKNEDNSYNWKNLLIGGSWFNLFKLIGIVGLILFFAWSYRHDVLAIKEFCNPIYYPNIINEVIP
jgi:hypothetical protein